jgi:hypothetical protein
LEDKIPQKFFGEIDDVIAFSKKVNLNYDCLRAIAFEISQGEPFKGAIKDLNIINMDSERYSVVLHYANGMSISSRGVYLDLFNDDNETVYLYDKRGEYIAEIDFNPTNCEYDPKRLTNILLPNAFHIDYTTDNDSKEFVEQLKAASIEYLSIARQNGKNLHYVV